jgi:mRNA interferase RelE/StbE
MKLIFRESFEKDLKSIKNPLIFKQVKKLIMNLENSSDLSAIPNVKKLSGSKNLYRIRLGDYRVGIALLQNSVEIVRILHRKEIYRYFS